MSYNTPCRASPGAADLERPAGEAPPPPRRDLLCAGCAWIPGSSWPLEDDKRFYCSGTLEVSFGLQTILRGGRGANFSALGDVVCVVF